MSRYFSCMSDFITLQFYELLVILQGLYPDPFYLFPAICPQQTIIFLDPLTYESCSRITSVL